MIQKDMEKKQQNMTTLNHLDLTEIKIVEKKKTRYLGLVDISQTNSMEEIIDQSVIGAKKYHLHRLYNASYGSMLSVENIYRGKFETKR